MSDRSDDQEWSMMVSEAFAFGDDDFLSNLFGWDDIDDVDDEV